MHILPPFLSRMPNLPPSFGGSGSYRGTYKSIGSTRGDITVGPHVAKFRTAGEHEKGGYCHGCHTPLLGVVCWAGRKGECPVGDMGLKGEVGWDTSGKAGGAAAAAALPAMCLATAKITPASSTQPPTPPTMPPTRAAFLLKVEAGGCAAGVGRARCGWEGKQAADAGLAPGPERHRSCNAPPPHLDAIASGAGAGAGAGASRHGLYLVLDHNDLRAWRGRRGGGAASQVGCLQLPPRRRAAHCTWLLVSTERVQTAVLPSTELSATPSERQALLSRRRQAVGCPAS